MKIYFDHEKLKVYQGKERLHGIVSMLVGLIRSNSPDRLHDDEVEYIIDRPDRTDERIGDRE